MYNKFKMKKKKLNTYIHKIDKSSLNSFKFKGFDKTSNIPASKHYLISSSAVNAVNPIILIKGMTLFFINYCNFFVVSTPFKIGI